MADTRRLLSAILSLFADNTVKAISEQDLRDFVVSVFGYRTIGLVSSTPTTLTTDDDVVIVDATSGAITINLPAVSGAQGKVYTIKKKDATGNTVTIDGAGAENIDGAATYVLSAQYKYVTIAAFNSTVSWWVISNN